MTKYIRKLALLAGVEASAGTWAAPAVADTIEAANVTLTPIDGQEAERNLIRPWFGASETVLATRFRKITFDVGFAGVGTAGAIPGWARLLRGCAASCTHTPGESTVFAPVTDDLEALSLYTVIDRIAYKMAGARGNAKITVDAKGIPNWNFEFTGAFVPLQDLGAMPAVDYTQFLPVLPVNRDNTTLSVDGVDVSASAFSLDFGNTVVKQDLINVDDTDITGRSSTASVTLRMTDVAAKDWVGLALAGAKVPVALAHGPAAPNQVRIAIPQAQIGKPSFSDQDGVQMITIPMRCIPVLGNDEWQIIA